MRDEDVTGVSGVGRVAEGVQFSTGDCVLVWLGTLSSVVVYRSLADLEAIHGHGGSSRVIWED